MTTLRNHVENRLAGEMSERERVRIRMEERGFEYKIAVEAVRLRREELAAAVENARRAFHFYKVARDSNELMEERIAFLEMTMAEFDDA